MGMFFRISWVARSYSKARGLSLGRRDTQTTHNATQQLETTDQTNTGVGLNLYNRVLSKIRKGMKCVVCYRLHKLNHLSHPEQPYIL